MAYSARAALRWVGVAVAGAILLLAVSAVALRTPWVQSRLRGEIERRASLALNAEVSVGTIGGTLLSWTTLENVAVRTNGEMVVAIDRVRVDYDLLRLLGGTYDVDRLVLDQPVVRADAFGALAGIGGGDSDEGASAGGRFSIAAIVVRNGRVIVGPDPAEINGIRVPDVIDDLAAELSLTVAPSGTAVNLDRLSFTGVAPSLTLEEARGRIVLRDGGVTLEDMLVKTGGSTFEFGGRIGALVVPGDGTVGSEA